MRPGAYGEIGMGEPSLCTGRGEAASSTTGCCGAMTLSGACRDGSFLPSTSPCIFHRAARLFSMARA